jgi:hypothetical protein
MTRVGSQRHSKKINIYISTQPVITDSLVSKIIQSSSTHYGYIHLQFEKISLAISIQNSPVILKLETEKNGVVRVSLNKQ